MTMSLNNVAVQQFRDAFQNQYQAGRKLDGLGQIVRGVVGDAYKFKLAGKVDMELRGAFQSPVPASDLTYSAPSVSFSNYILNLPTDIFEQAEVNANERQNLARVHANAIGRREDQFLIDALDASATSKTVAVGTTNLSLAKIISAAKQLNDDEVPMDNRHFVVGASQLDSILRDTTITDSDFNSVRLLMGGTIDSFMGFKWHIIGNRAIGGLPKTGNNRTVYAFHGDSVGLAYRINPQVTVDWDPHIQSWMSISKMSMGATSVDDLGIVKVTCDETK